MTAGASIHRFRLTLIVPALAGQDKEQTLFQSGKTDWDKNRSVLRLRSFQ